MNEVYVIFGHLLFNVECSVNELPMLFDTVLDYSTSLVTALQGTPLSCLCVHLPVMISSNMSVFVSIYDASSSGVYLSCEFFFF